MASAEDSRLCRQSAIAEAHALYRMLGQDGNTVEELRELIAMPPRIELALRAYARAHPEEAHFVDRVLKFREAVAQEFERLVRDGVPVADLLEVEEQESYPAKETFAVACA
jgi:hypothetical protein